MINKSQLTRFPAIRFWIKSINEGIYHEGENTFQTIFGKVKRVSIVATILDKREITMTNQKNSFSIDGISSSFELDDGTGLINAVKWNMSPDEFINYNPGDLVLVIGLLRNRFGSPNITIEIIKKIENPNDFLLHDVKIIKKIKSGDIENLPNKLSEEGSNELQLEMISEFGDKDESKALKYRILTLIQNNTKNNKGTHLRDLKKIMETNEKEIKRFIRDLEYEGKIFLSDEETYLSWD